jgi:LPXTG-site transpeptidase (sortase) family protein
MTKKTLFINLVGVSLVIAGAVLLIAIIRSRAVNIVSTPPAHHAAAVTTPTQAQSTTAVSTPDHAPQGYITGTPVRINIPSVGIDLPVIPGYYDATSQEWTLTTDKAQFATVTSAPNNQGGNTFIYGHARRNIFGSLPKLRAGAVAIVTTSNGHRFYYTLGSTQIVDPQNANAAIGDSSKPILTLQTCVGLLYQSRELLTFNLARVA